MEVKMTIDAQYLIESYTRQVLRDGTAGLTRSVADRGAHLLLVIDNESPIQYKVRFGGAKRPETTYIRGYGIPLIMNYSIPIAEACDHFWGCSKLSWETDKELVLEYIKRISKILSYEDRSKRLYLDSGLDFEIPKDYYSNIYEGILPVLVTGESVMGPKFEKPTKAFIITGNCV